MYPSVVHTTPKRYVLREKGRKIERTVIDIPESDLDLFYRALSIGVASAAPKKKTALPVAPKSSTEPANVYFDAEGFGHYTAAVERHGEIRAGEKMAPVITNL